MKWDIISSGFHETSDRLMEFWKWKLNSAWIHCLTLTQYISGPEPETDEVYPVVQQRAPLVFVSVNLISKNNKKTGKYRLKLHFSLKSLLHINATVLVRVRLYLIWSSRWALGLFCSAARIPNPSAEVSLAGSFLPARHTLLRAETKTTCK